MTTPAPRKTPLSRSQRVARRNRYVAGAIVVLMIVLMVHMVWITSPSAPTTTAPHETSLAIPGGKTGGLTKMAKSAISTPAPEPAPPLALPAEPIPEARPKSRRDSPIPYEEHLTGDHKVTTPQTRPLTPSPPNTGERPRVAIIIDDMGYNGPVSLAIARLPAAITLAVLPGGGASKQVAELGKSVGKEVILHQPMEPIGFPAMNPGPGALMTGMNAEQVETILSNNLRLFPEATGINNHMGSKLTTDRRVMDLVMRSLQRRGLFFVDSRTAGSSVAVAAATMAGVPRTHRDVFLDNEEDKHYIMAQLGRLEKLVFEQREAIGIGHAYPETLQALQDWLPTLRGKGIDLVRASQMVTPIQARPLYAAGARGH